LSDAGAFDDFDDDWGSVAEVDDQALLEFELAPLRPRV
jgi:hypothetical protein